MTHGMVVADKALKERSLYVYLPSTAMAKDWKERADKKGVSISKFVIEHVSDSLRRLEGENDGQFSKQEISQKLRETEDELKRITKDARLYKQLAEKFDNELKYYRTKPFLDEKFEGIRAYDKELIALLKKKGAVDSDDLLDELGIDPKEVELVKGIRNQLENLSAYGLVKPTARGWKWIKQNKVADASWP